MFFGHSLQPGQKVDVVKNAPCKGILLLTNVCLTSGDKAGLHVHLSGGQVLVAAALTSAKPQTLLQLRVDTASGPCFIEARNGAVDVLGFVEDPRDDAEASESQAPAKAQQAKAESAPKKDAPKAAAQPAKKEPAKAAQQPQEKKPPVVVGGPDFIPSKQWTGVAPGMVFKKGPKGIGYYKDTPLFKAGGQKRKADEPASGESARKATTLPGGLKFEVQKAGASNAPTAGRGKTVQVRYEGRLAKNGKRFDKGTIRFRLGAGEVIKGWDLGVAGMKVGEQRKLLIPPQLAYGPRGAPPDIPPNAPLTFDVELLKIS